MAFLGQSLGLLIFALSFIGRPDVCRVARAEALAAIAQFRRGVARSWAARDSRIIVKHVMPNLMQTAIVVGGVAMSTAMISGRPSFLGIGVPPTFRPGANAEPSRSYITSHWCYRFLPGSALFFTVLGINLLGRRAARRPRPRAQRSGSGRCERG